MIFVPSPSTAVKLQSCWPTLTARCGYEFQSVVGADVSGSAPQDEEVGQNVDHIDRLELAGDTDRQAFMAELVEHVEYPIPASVMGAVAFGDGFRTEN
jgi:hypothetical protein